MFKEDDFVSVKDAVFQSILQIKDVVKRRSGRIEYICSDSEGDEYLLEESDIELYEDRYFRQQKREE